MENYINSAVEQFRSILTEQIARQRKMEQDKRVTDYSKLDKIIIGICGGDGIGPIISAESERLLQFILKDEIAAGKIELRTIEGLTIEIRIAHNQDIPDDVLGSRGVEIPDTLAFDFKVTTNEGTKRIARAAFEYAKNNGKTSVAIVTKANIMKKTDGKFSDLCHEVAKDYPGIEAEDWYIDIMTANLVNERTRSKFQVFVLPNLYGDIITDEAAQIQGGVGTAGSANLGDVYAMFEAIHGSAPRMIETGRGQFANPTSMFKATEMLLRHIGFVDKANKLNEALHICTEVEKKYVITGHEDGATCSQFGDYLMQTIETL